MVVERLTAHMMEIDGSVPETLVLMDKDSIRRSFSLGGFRVYDGLLKL